MVLTTIRLSKPGLSPPVYIAGTFTQWQPSIEMDHDAIFGSQDQHEFSKTVDIEPGEHQYKFRLGHGDWWMADESFPIATDESGNVNNVIQVFEDGKPETSVHETNSQLQPVKKDTPVHKVASRSTLSSNTSAGSDSTKTAPASAFSAQSDSQKPIAKSLGGQDNHENGKAVAPTDRVDATRQDKSTKNPSRSLVSKLLCCFSGKTVVGMAAVSALLIAVYMRR